MRIPLLFFISAIQIWAAEIDYEIKKDISYRENTQALSEYQRERCFLDIHHPS